MASPTTPAAFALLLAAPAAMAQDSSSLAGVELAQLSIHQRIVIRVPRMPMPSPAMALAPDLPPITWVEKKAPKCIAADSLAAAAITRADSVDLMVRGGSRLRAKLGDHCAALGFYSGFYLEQAKDGQVCAHRDSIRSRSGEKCAITAFKRLVPSR